ncbi:hypothetical protein KCP78_12735 [Salmonella enterica subsp. enterica]|nr:hypothetical protein KCP78_12735 [Salmonella enterica subsp. enterica]
MCSARKPLGVTEATALLSVESAAEKTLLWQGENGAQDAPRVAFASASFSQPVERRQAPPRHIDHSVHALKIIIAGMLVIPNGRR